jgi:hypothetical protein
LLKSKTLALSPWPLGIHPPLLQVLHTGVRFHLGLQPNEQDEAEQYCLAVLVTLALMDAIIGGYKARIEETLGLWDFISVYRRTLLALQRDTDALIARVVVDEHDE